VPFGRLLVPFRTCVAHTHGGECAFPRSQSAVSRLEPLRRPASLYSCSLLRSVRMEIFRSSAALVRLPPVDSSAARIARRSSSSSGMTSTDAGVAATAGSFDGSSVTALGSRGSCGGAIVTGATGDGVGIGVGGGTITPLAGLVGCCATGVVSGALPIEDRGVMVGKPSAAGDTGRPVSARMTAR